jgi:sugar porter (SP) family MFS transporter
MADPAMDDMASAGRASRKGRRVTGLATAIAALGGLLFGYDTGIISSALLYFPESFGARTRPDGTLAWETDLFGLLTLTDDRAVEVIVAALLLGAVVGAICGGAVADRIGRRPTMLAVALIFVVGAVASGLATSAGSLVLARVILGVAIGISSVAVPAYIAELSPRMERGRLVTMNQLMVTVGIFASYLVGFLLAPSASWRQMLLLGAVPGLVMLLGLLFVPESPRWLIVHGKPGQARESLLLTRDPEDAETEIYEITEHAKVESSRGWSDLLRPRLRPALLLGVGIAVLTQVVGVNAVVYYTPRILRDIFGEQVALLVTMVVGFLNMVVTYVAFRQIDRWGRRPLIIGGSLVVAVSLLGLAAVFLAVPDDGRPSGLVGVGLVLFLCIYIAAFAASLGIGIWLVNSEVYPTPVRGKAASVGSTAHWLLDMVIALNVLTLVGAIGASGLFAVFAVFALAGTLFLWRRLPETRGRSLEQISLDLQRS